MHDGASTSAGSHDPDRSAPRGRLPLLHGQRHAGPRGGAAGSTIDARPGGRVLIRYPNAVEATGEVVEVSPPERIIFTYGYAPPALPPPGGSLVTIRLEAASRGTRLHLVHEFADAAARDHHVQGWRYQLSLFANVVSDEALHDAPGRVDRWFDAWAESDDAARRQALTDIVVSQYPPSRSLQLRGRDRRAHRTHRCGTAVHARRQDEGRWRSAPVPGHGPRRVDRDGRRRATAVAGHECVRVRPRRTDRIRDGLLVTAGVIDRRRFTSRPSCRARRPTRSDQPRFAGSVMENPDAPGFTSSRRRGVAQKPCRRDRAPKGRHRQMAICRPVEHVEVQLPRFARRPPHGSCVANGLAVVP